MKRKKNYDKKVFRALSLVTQFGIYMIVSIGIMIWLGMYLDEKFGTSYMVILMFFVGALAGGQGIFRTVKSILKEQQESEKNEEEKDK